MEWGRKTCQVNLHFYGTIKTMSVDKSARRYNVKINKLPQSLVAINNK